MTPATTPALTLNNAVTMPALGLGVFQSPPEETTAAVETALRDGAHGGAHGVSTLQPGKRLGDQCRLRRQNGKVKLEIDATLMGLAADRDGW